MTARPWLWIASAAVLLAASGAALYRLAARPHYPRPGDHWHAALSIELCGEVMPPMAAFPGPVHSHGDGLIHIHPANERQARLDTLEGYFAIGGGAIAAEVLRLPSGRIYRAGDRRPDGKPAELLVIINGKIAPDGRTRVLQNGDEVRIIFSP